VAFWLASMVTAAVPTVCRARIPEASAVCTKPPDPELLALIVVVMGYSYKMLIEPASKVSVPLTVVMRTRSRVPEVVFLPLIDSDCVEVS